MTDNKTASAKSDAKPGERSGANPGEKPGAKSDMPDNKKPTAEKKPAAKTSAKKSKRVFPWLKVLLFIVLIAALGFGGWKGWLELQTQIQSRIGVSDQFQADIDTLQSQLEQQQQLNRQIAQQFQSMAQLEEQLYFVTSRVNSQGERILQLGTASRGDWLLSEAAYLIRLANQRLQVERSTENPLAILENVNTILVQLDDPELLSVRRALAEDMAALRMTGKVDREGIFLEIEAISSVIKDLSIIQQASLSSATELAPDQQGSDQENGHSSALVNSLERFSQKLGQLIVVQKRSEPIEPLLTTNEQAIVQGNLNLLLEQAQSALLREEPVIFSSSLDKSAALLTKYFQLNSQSEALIERLNILKQRVIVQELPDISGSIVAVQTALNLRQSRISDGEQEK